MKKILGLDLGTNSIGWALVERDFEARSGKILGKGSRIIPTDSEVLGRYSSGKSLSKSNAGQAYTPAGKRTDHRGARRLRERHYLRRERLHRVLNVLGFLPEHYTNQIDFKKHFGQFINDSEPKLPWQKIGDNPSEFIFQNSFNEMLADFTQHQPQLVSDDKKVPYDWTIYYLRKKALTEKLEKEELAWIILNFNQKRGYYQLRGEDDEDTTKTAKTRKYFDRQVIKNIIDTNETYKGLRVLVVELENGNKGKIFKKEIPQWIGSEKNIIASVDIDKDGNDKYEDNGLLSQKFSIPTDAEWETEWKLIKLKTEKDLRDSDQSVGTYIYETLLQNPTQKIIGKLVRTIERNFYKDELIAILKKQIELQPELFTEDLYNDCIRELYRNNEEHKLILSKPDFVHLFVNDIIFYQRSLRSQKSSIGNCMLECRKYKDKDGKEVKEYLKAIPKSHPIYQEFRLWQWLFNLKIYKRDDDSDVTGQFIASISDKENLFNFLNYRKEIDQKALLKHFKLAEKTHRWNFVEDKAYPCNETGTQIRTRLTKVKNISTGFLTPEMEQRLWHIVYSVTDKHEFEKALKTFAKKYYLDETSFVENFKKFPPFKSEYGSFSEKAIRKLLPLMRLGKYWNWGAIDKETKERINKIITGEYDENIKLRVREKAINLTEENRFQGLQLWLAQYIVYDRHSEAGITDKWKTVADLEKYIDEFKQHSLRNPIVEQVIMETLRVVRDIWRKYGDFSEIHVELGREMKNTAEERERISNQISENENTNLRIKALIMELKDNSDEKLTVENVRPYSPIQQDILKIYEEGVINSKIEIPEDILKISKMAQPSKSELQRYKLWLEQKYRSPYTGEMIPLGKLFTDEYEIEHIIPQSRYFDDSLNNKIICEKAVNNLKGKQLGFEFIKKHHGEKVECGMGKKVEIFTEEAYQKFIKEHYAKNRSKHTKLLLEEIPENMAERQLNDTRYISKFISQILSNIVREETNDDGVNSKNLISCNGKITDRLKKDWGLNDVWNKLILPRFERMNELTHTKYFTSKNKEGHTIPAMPLELSKGFQKKRIDHRHHAMDALIIACATRDHVNLLNNQSAKSENSRYDLQNKLRHKGKESWIDKKTNEKVEKDVFKEFKKPWDNFTVDVRNELEKIVVSFKQNLRVINRIRFKGLTYKESKELSKEKNWGVRKPLHKDTFYAKVSLRKIKKVQLNNALKDWKMIVDNELKQEIKQLITTYGSEFKIDAINKYFKDKKYIFNEKDISIVDIYYFEEKAAVRKSLDTSFTEKTIKESVTDTGIQKILIKHLEKYNEKKDGKIVEHPELAFAPEGIEEMNKNIVDLNDGKFHQSIYKVRVYEAIGNKFPIGTRGNKKDKYVEAAQGTNLFFAVYADKDNNRSYETIPLNIVIERLKQGLKEVPETNEKGHSLLFHLSPNDLVYVPTEEERENLKNITFTNLTKEQMCRLWVVNDFSSAIYFRPHSFAKSIAPKEVDLCINKEKNKLQGSFDEKTASFEGEQIKDVCIKLNIDRLGNIGPA